MTDEKCVIDGRIKQVEDEISRLEKTKQDLEKKRKNLDLEGLPERVDEAFTSSFGKPIILEKTQLWNNAKPTDSYWLVTKLQVGNSLGHTDIFNQGVKDRLAALGLELTAVTHHGLFFVGKIDRKKIR